MRPIKFRFIFKNDNGDTGVIYKTIEELIKGDLSWVYLKSQELKLVARDQFTGLTDKNGVEIFEGDFISGQGCDVVLVVWSESNASFGLDKSGWAFLHYFGEAMDADKCEVIGNIHTNPELVKI